mmetsp:Transcript_3694/g.11128  ORF Transcript_3694/g.11128 Transcript_3694/m.11128 type:complete len:228 (-) Transcript_3694:45-728(-)
MPGARRVPRGLPTAAPPWRGRGRERRAPVRGPRPGGQGCRIPAPPRCRPRRPKGRPPAVRGGPNVSGQDRGLRLQLEAAGGGGPALGSGVQVSRNSGVHRSRVLRGWRLRGHEGGRMGSWCEPVPAEVRRVPFLEHDSVRRVRGDQGVQGGGAAASRPQRLGEPDAGSAGHAADLSGRQAHRGRDPGDSVGGDGRPERPWERQRRRDRGELRARGARGRPPRCVTKK